MLVSLLLWSSFPWDYCERNNYITIHLSFLKSISAFKIYRVMKINKYQFDDLTIKKHLQKTKKKRQTTNLQSVTNWGRMRVSIKQKHVTDFIYIYMCELWLVHKYKKPEVLIIAADSENVNIWCMNKSE